MADLRAFRKANKLTQEQVADFLGIKKPFICKIETGREAFPDKHLRKLLSNSLGWNTSALTNISETFDCADSHSTEQTDTPADMVVVSQQMLDELSAQRQLAEQALDLVREQLDAKQQTILAVREQLTTTQEQLSAEQEQTAMAQLQLTTEQEQTNKVIEEVIHSRRQMDELIIMLKKADARIEREMALIEQQHHKEQLRERDHEHPTHKQHSTKSGS